MTVMFKPRRFMKLPRDPLFRLLLINGIAGLAIAFLVMGGIFWANIGNLRVLVLSAEDPILPVIMLGFSMVITLVSAVVGSAIMLISDNDRQGGKPIKALDFKFTNKPEPVPVAAVSRRKNIG